MSNMVCPSSMPRVAKRRWMLALGEGEAATQGTAPPNLSSPERAMENRHEPRHRSHGAFVSSSRRSFGFSLGG